MKKTNDDKASPINALTSINNIDRPSDGSGNRLAAQGKIYRYDSRVMLTVVLCRVSRCSIRPHITYFRAYRSFVPIPAKGEDSMGRSEFDPGAKGKKPWNAGRRIGAKRALKPQQVWAIRFWLEHQQRVRDRALFDLAIDSNLRGCDLVRMKIGDIVRGGEIRSRALVVQKKTGRPVQFELLETARISIRAWLERRGGSLDDYVFPNRVDHTKPMSTRQYARLVEEWVIGVGLRRED